MANKRFRPNRRGRKLYCNLLCKRTHKEKYCPKQLAEAGPYQLEPLGQSSKPTPNEPYVSCFSFLSELVSVVTSCKVARAMHRWIILSTLIFSFLQTETWGNRFQSSFGKKLESLQGLSGGFRTRTARHGEGGVFEPGNLKLQKPKEGMVNTSRNGVARNGHLQGQTSNTHVAKAANINNVRQNQAKSSWIHFLQRRQSEIMSIFPIKPNEDHGMCRAVPFSQRVRHEDCETLALGNNVCFGKCNPSIPDLGNGSCAQCSPVSFTHKSVQLKCKDNTHIFTVVNVVVDCHCALKNERYSQDAHSLFGPMGN